MKPETEIELPVRYQGAGHIVDANDHIIIDIGHLPIDDTGERDARGEHIAHVLNDHARLAAEVKELREMMQDAYEISKGAMWGIEHLGVDDGDSKYGLRIQGRLQMTGGEVRMFNSPLEAFRALKSGEVGNG